MRCAAGPLPLLTLSLALTVLACGDDTGGSATAGDSGGATSASPSATSAGGTSSGDGGEGPGPSSSSGQGGVGPAGTTTSTVTGGGEGGSGGAEPVLEEVHHVGRFEAVDGGNRSSWSNSTVRTRVDGTGLDVAFASASAGVWFQVAIDGAPTSTFVTAGGAATHHIDLPGGIHDVEVVRRNEASLGSTTIATVTASEGSTLVPTAARTRRLEFIGDSLTAGYGIECASAQENFTAATESSYTAYAAVAARALDADAHVIAWSGKGMVKNCCGNTDPPMPAYYGMQNPFDEGPGWDFSTWTPHAVVINLGTNDFNPGVDDTTFVQGYTAFVGVVRSYYPDAPIVAVTWAHWGASREALVTQAVAASGDPAVFTTRFAIGAEEGLGCDYHTNVVTNARLGAELATTLGTLLGWD
jgi:hypothetical protein